MWSEETGEQQWSKVVKERMGEIRLALFAQALIQQQARLNELEEPSTDDLADLLLDVVWSGFEISTEESAVDRLNRFVPRGTEKEKRTMTTLMEQAEEAECVGKEQAEKLCIDQVIRTVADHYDGPGLNVYARVTLGPNRELSLSVTGRADANGTKAEIHVRPEEGPGTAILVYKAREYGSYVEAFRPGDWVNILIERAKIVDQEDARQAVEDEKARARATIKAFSPVQ